MKKILLLSFLSLSLGSIAQEKEPYLSNETYTYEGVIEEYNKLAEKYPDLCQMQKHGYSDYGEEMSLFIISKVGFKKENFRDKAVIMINNGIHPGEPCGVDASVKLSKELLADPKLISEEVVIGIIPLYNIGGANNRSCCSRTNQNGPNFYGFRGNAKNLDLNRDFIKADSKNTLAFYEIYHLLNPHLFIDTHTSNGADYQHTMTLITSQVDKMHPKLRTYTLEKLNPYLFEQMEKNNFPMAPYVHTMKRIPDDGIKDYLESPRYSTGYTNLFNTIGYVSETHMLKTFEDRVESTYVLLKLLNEYAGKNHEELKDLKREIEANIGEEKEFGIAWSLDTNRYDMIDFLGYEAEYKKSEVSGTDRLFYNHEKPYNRKIKYYNHYLTTQKIIRPKYYVIPKAWDFVVDLFKANNIEVLQLSSDAEIEVEVYRISKYDNINRPYEGHFLHHSVEVQAEKRTINYKKGDYIVPTTNKNVRFIVETLEPHATDSYLAWNYFDAVLQQKEWYSAYVFEDEAAEILKNKADVKKRFDERMATDESFANSPSAQLYFVFQNSVHYEETHNVYPIARLTRELPETLIAQ